MLFQRTTTVYDSSRKLEHKIPCMCKKSNQEFGNIVS